MPVRKPLLMGDITLSGALDSQQHILTQLEYPEQQRQLYDHLVKNLNTIEAITSRILGVEGKQCLVVRSPDNWIRGSFNVCIPLRVKIPNNRSRYFIFRVPLPYKIGESFTPGNVDEKIRSEAGTYAWIKENCPDIPIPHLRGFGLTNGNVFMSVDQKVVRQKRSLFRLASARTPVQNKKGSYRVLSNSAENSLGTGFLLLDNIEGKNSSMLSYTWRDHYKDETKRTTFFSHLSRIMLALAQIPHKDIASPCFNDDCTITFTNRPMTPYLAQMENEKVSIPIKRNHTFSHCSSYVSDLLRCQDNFLYHARNSVSDKGDAEYQTAILTGMRAIQPSFFTDASLRGPFHMAFTDLHSSNIFVDKDWRITSIIDLEWVGTRPLEMISPPDWLCEWSDHLAASTELRALQDEFISILQSEEDQFRQKVQEAEKPSTKPPPPHLAQAMRKGAANGATWYFLALNSYSLTTFIWHDDLRDRYLTPKKKNSDKSEVQTEQQQPDQADMPVEPVEEAGKSEHEHEHDDRDPSTDPNTDVVVDDDEHFYSVAPRLWRQGYSDFVAKKLDDRARYEEDIRKAFEVTTREV